MKGLRSCLRVETKPLCSSLWAHTRISAHFSSDAWACLPPPPIVPICPLPSHQFGCWTRPPSVQLFPPSETLFPKPPALLCPTWRPHLCGWALGSLRANSSLWLVVPECLCPPGYNQILIVPVGATSIRIEEAAASRNFLGEDSFGVWGGAVARRWVLPWQLTGSLPWRSGEEHPWRILPQWALDHRGRPRPARGQHPPALRAGSGRGPGARAAPRPRPHLGAPGH